MTFYVGNLLSKTFLTTVRQLCIVCIALRRGPLWLAFRCQEPDQFQEAIAPCLSNGRITDLAPI
jgi:hypothetical protein